MDLCALLRDKFTHVSMPACPEAKISPGFFDLMAFLQSPKIVCTVVQCWQSNAKAKLRQVRSMTNSKTNVKQHVPVEKIVLTQSYDANILPAASYLDAGSRIKDSGRSVDTYIHRDRKPSQHVTVGLAWGSPQLKNTRGLAKTNRITQNSPSQKNQSCSISQTSSNTISVSVYRCLLYILALRRLWLIIE